MGNQGKKSVTTPTPPSRRPGRKSSPPAAQTKDTWERWWVVLCLAGVSGVLVAVYGMRTWKRNKAASEVLGNNFDGVVLSSCVVGESGDDDSTVISEKEPPPSLGASGVSTSVPTPTVPSPTEGGGTSSLCGDEHSCLEASHDVVEFSRQQSVEDEVPPPSGGAARRGSRASSAASSRRNSIGGAGIEDHPITSKDFVFLVSKYRVEKQGFQKGASNASRIVFGQSLHNRQAVAVKLFKNQHDFEWELDFLRELQEPTKVIPLYDPIYGCDEKNEDDDGSRERENLGAIFPQFPAGGLVMQKAERSLQEFLYSRGAGELSFPEALLWSQQMVGIVAWIHSRGIVWANCKLANFLLVLEPGSVLPVLKGCDFGKALEVGDVFPPLSSVDGATRNFSRNPQILVTGRVVDPTKFCLK